MGEKLRGRSQILVCVDIGRGHSGVDHLVTLTEELRRRARLRPADKGE